MDNCYSATQHGELFPNQISRKPAHTLHPSLAQASRCGWNPRTPTPHQWRRERPSCRSQRPQKTTSFTKTNIQSHSCVSWIFFASNFIPKKGDIWGIQCIRYTFSWSPQFFYTVALPSWTRRQSPRWRCPSPQWRSSQRRRHQELAHLGSHAPHSQKSEHIRPPSGRRSVTVVGVSPPSLPGQGTEGHAGQLALGGRQHFTHSLGGSGSTRDDVAGSSTASSPVLARMNTQTIDASMARLWHPWTMPWSFNISTCNRRFPSLALQFSKYLAAKMAHSCKRKHSPWLTHHPRSSEWRCRSGWWSSGPSRFQRPPGPRI